MKLATALLERADLQTKISELAIRLNNNAKVQEGEEPAEDPIILLQELNRLTAQLENLIARINVTNSTVVIDGVTITELLAKRDVLKTKYQTIRNFLDCASQQADRYAHSEIKIKSTVKISEIQKKADEISKEIRETDEKIQERNWTTELK